MGQPSFFELIWEGCGHNEDERGIAFDSDYNRYCEVCKKQLTGKWICKKDLIVPKQYKVDINNKLYLVISVCPECGGFFDYETKLK